MKASPFLILFLLFICQGEEQDNSLTSGILKTMKGQKKVETSQEVSCPEPPDIEPCECLKYEGLLLMNCSNVQDEEQLRKVFSASFPTNDFYTFEMNSNKGVKVLEDEVFGDVTFQEFVIAGSALETVRNDALKSSLSTLKTIYISSCELAIFPFERLAEFTLLTHLSLSFNKIHSLPPLSSSSLIYFDLRLNPISHLSPDVFKGLQTVKGIYFDGCNLTEITPGTFNGLPELYFLALPENKISYLQSFTFDLMSPPFEKGHLDLANNNIDFVEVDAFKGVQEHSGIDMQNNALITLEEEVWRSVLEKDILVRLAGNDLSCGCDVAWLVRDSQLLILAQGARCVDGTLLTDLNPADFDICG